jgi:NAD(P)-dependent dehydrogenase (short-subunit alcohol dehydrogenase family)
MDFDGKVVVVTGGGAGIGRATSLALGKAGARVVIGNRNSDQGDEVVEAIRDAGGEALFQQTDVTNAEQVQALIQKAVSEYGAVNLAFNNAGTEGELGALHEIGTEAAANLFDVNINGVFYALKYEIEEMLKIGGGAIVNTSSIFGFKAAAGFSPYIASKHAIAGLTRAAALDYATQGIRINAVAPGPINTRMLIDVSGGDPDVFSSFVPMERIGQPEEVAEAVLWLLSEQASYVNGHLLSVDGAWCAN